MTRHLASKKTKQILTESKLVTIPYPISFGWIMLIFGILTSFYESNIWILSFYIFIVTIGLMSFSMLLAFDKMIKPSRKFVGILGLSMLWCLGNGWWVVTFYWFLISILVLILMDKSMKQ